MRWYLPTWNGDIRAESTDSGDTALTIIEPTALELMTLGRLEHQFRENGWWKGGPLWRPATGRRKAAKRRTVTISASLDAVAPLLVAGYKPGAQTLTTIVYRDGKVETVDGTQGDAALAKSAKKAVSKKAKKATTVKRATPCCPQCTPGSIEPAREVLLEFLNDEQHRSWAEHRHIVVRGGRTGHRYLLAHRHSPTAISLGRICFDLDDRTVLHFHDNGVPPEEEVLGAKQVLEHREHWLRNEATVIDNSFRRDGSIDDNHEARSVFDNPFGDHLDGVEDAGITQMIGSTLMGMASGMGIEGIEEEWLRELGRDFEKVFEPPVSAYALDDDADQATAWDPDPIDAGDFLSPAEAEFFKDAVTLGRAAPKAMAHVAVHWRRRALGYAAPDWYA